MSTGRMLEDARERLKRARSLILSAQHELHALGRDIDVVSLSEALDYVNEVIDEAHKGA